MPQEDQHVVLEWEKITHRLRVNKVTRGSVGGVAAKQQDHLQTESRPRPKEYQQVVLQQNNKIIYSLRASQCHKKVSRYCGKTITSLTY